MKKETFEASVSGIRDEYLEEALDYEERRKKRGKSAKLLVHVLIAAAAALMLAGAALGVYAAVTSAGYRTALTFFSEKELNSAGLSEEELKAVYKDIESGTFRLEKTKEVLMNCGRVRWIRDGEAGAVNADALAPEDLRNLWNFSEELPSGFETQESGVRWYFDNEADEGALIVKFEDGKKVFSALIGGMDASGVQPLSSGGALIYGNGRQKPGGFVAKLDSAGKLMWKDDRGDRQMRFEYFEGAFEDEQGRAVFVGTCRRSGVPETINSLSFAVYDEEGREVLFTETVLPGTSALVTGVRYTGKMCLVQVLRTPERGQNSIIELGTLGQIERTFCYPDDGYDIFIGDVLTDHGTTYLAVTAAKRPQNTLSYSSDPSQVLDEYIALRARNDRTNAPPSSEELTDALREGVLSAIFRCDPEEGLVTVCSVGGTLLRGAQTDGDGGFVLTVLEPTAVLFLPQTTADYFGSAQIVCYTYKDAQLQLSRKTGRYVPIFWNDGVAKEEV